MKIIGKIGEEPTELDRDSSNEELDLKLANLKCASIGSFTSIRTNNCLFKGKWCYEILLMSNKLIQVGWCQLITPFKSKDGVGDDPSSYAYDGYRVAKWHAGKEKYGMNWDYGDIIGVCIDLDDRKMEFYHNGKYLGVAFDNIPVGENIAYFPGASLSKNEKVIFNFGNFNMKYEYDGYEPMDVPKSIYDNSYDITKDLIEIMNSHTLKILALKEISKCHKFLISQHVLNFIIEVSFKDYFIFRELLVPFMIKLITKDELPVFFDNILICANSRSEFIYELFENLCNLIEYHAIRKLEFYQQWVDLINLFKRLLKIDVLAQSWVESRKCSQHLKMIFNGNFLSMSDIVPYILEQKQKYEEKAEKLTVSENAKKFYKETRSELEVKHEILGNVEYESKINKILIDLIQYFIMDGRTFRANHKNVTLRSLLLENFTKTIKENSFLGNDIFNFINGISSVAPNESYIKYFYFNLLEIFFTECLNSDINQISLEPFMSRSRSDSLYYDEVGIGGTISHVNSEYGSRIKPEYKEKKDFSMINTLFHRILYLTSSYIVPVMRDYQKYLKINENFMQCIHRESTRSIFIQKSYRSYMNVFSKRNQQLLYRLSYFLVNLINSLVKENKEILYFIPKSVMQIPYEIFRVLIHIKSPLIKSKESRMKANENFPFCSEDNYVYQILYFYCLLFNDSNIANPELKENFMGKITYFLKKKFIVTEFDKDQILLEMLIKGLMKNMTNDLMSHYASENMVKLIKPSCFGEKNPNYARVNLIRVVKKFFENNIKVFHEFMDNYNKILNKIMTDYTVSLTESSNKILSNNLSNADPYENSVSLFKKLMFNYSIFCDLMRILEFLLSAYPNEFFDTQTINFSRISNFLKNLSSRILDKGYLDNLISLIEKFKHGKSKNIFSSMANSVIGIFLNINENKNLKNYSEFVNKLVSQSDFDVEPFFNVLDHLKIEIHTQTGIDSYKEIICYFKSLKLNKVEKKMSEKEWEEKMENMYICIICYVNEMNRELIPCGHGKFIFIIIFRLLQ